METLHLDFEHLKNEGTEPEQVILYRLLSMFGPVPFELIAHINDEYWGELSTALSEAVAEEDLSLQVPQALFQARNFSHKKGRAQLRLPFISGGVRLFKVVEIELAGCARIHQNRNIREPGGGSPCRSGG